MKKEYARITLYLDANKDGDAIAMLRWIAEQADRSPSYIVRRLITAEYEKLGGPSLIAPPPPDA